jgi:hypothetical protein
LNLAIGSVLGLALPFRLPPAAVPVCVVAIVAGAALAGLRRGAAGRR